MLGNVPLLVPAHASHASLAQRYRLLASATPDAELRSWAAERLRQQLAELRAEPCELPDRPEQLHDWMQTNGRAVTDAYALYLQQRKAGTPRRYFATRAHALYFLRTVAPTKLVDGAWLYGLVRHARNPRLDHLVTTYVEELGAGEPDKNHVLLYRKLMARHGIETPDDLDDALYVQGLIQLGLGWNAEEFLPEIVGFNLGYEQLPLHLLITAYELNELGIDPYYFQLHVTVDNADTGHARRACDALLALLPRLCDGGAFWERVRNGSRLGEAGIGTTEVIQGFDIEQEVVRIFQRKCAAGHGAHSDYCRVAGRTINDWLSQPSEIPGFLAALQQAGWIKLGEPAANSRFWGLLQGERAEMFGVFNGYELQLVYDWIRGAAAADGQAYGESDAVSTRRASFRAAERMKAADAKLRGTPVHDVEPVDPDLEMLRTRLPLLDEAPRLQLLAEAMSPALHWTPAGLHATRVFCAESRV